MTYGFAAIAVFMCAYYLLFGVFSTVALGFNLLLLVAVLSMLQATLSLPGMAAICRVGTMSQPRASATEMKPALGEPLPRLRVIASAP